MAAYDYVIAGGGAAGLALAYHMAGSNLGDQSILIVDRDRKEHNDRTWSYWSARPTRVDHLAYRVWDQVEVISETFHRVFPLRPYRYYMVRGIDYYRGVREALSAFPQVTFQQGRVSHTADTRDKKGAQVVIDDVPVGARYAFDSIFTPSQYFKGPRGYHYLKQHFKGWEIETPNDVFDPHTVTMFDFRTPQKGAMRFFYILPFTRRRALIEYTLFSADLLKPHEYDRAISDYIEGVLRIPKYRTESVETGIIPMTDMPFSRRLGERVMAIGTKGGLVKASSGYAFLRMQQDAAHIVRSLENYGSPFHIPTAPARYHLFDTLMLQVMFRQGDRMKHIFTQLFKNNSIQSIFRFLDEEASIPENIRLTGSLPSSPFLKALFKVKLLRNV